VLGQTILPQTGGMQGWQTVAFVALLPQGNQTLRIYADKGNWNFNWFEALSSRTLAGRVEGESFDAMHEVRTETSGDTDGGLNVSYIDDNDWMDYNLKTISSGTYTSFRVANSYGNGIIEIKNAAGAILGQVNVPQTGGWQSWVTVSTELPFPPEAR
jgi:endoglucanase